MDSKYVYLHLPCHWTTSNYHLNFINQELPKIFCLKMSIEQAEFEFHTRIKESIKYDIVVSWGLDYHRPRTYFDRMRFCTKSYLVGSFSGVFTTK